MPLSSELAPWTNRQRAPVPSWMPQGWPVGALWVVFGPRRPVTKSLIASLPHGRRRHRTYGTPPAGSLKHGSMRRFPNPQRQASKRSVASDPPVQLPLYVAVICSPVRGAAWSNGRTIVTIVDDDPATPAAAPTSALARTPSILRVYVPRRPIGHAGAAERAAGPASRTWGESWPRRRPNRPIGHRAASPAFDRQVRRARMHQHRRRAGSQARAFTRMLSGSTINRRQTAARSVSEHAGGNSVARRRRGG